MATVRRKNPKRPVDALLNEARKEQRKQDHIPTESYIPVMKVLREEKEFTWREIQEWLEARGVKRSRGMLYGTYLRATSGKKKDQ